MNLADRILFPLAFTSCTTFRLFVLLDHWLFYSRCKWRPCRFPSMRMGCWAGEGSLTSYGGRSMK